MMMNYSNVIPVFEMALQFIGKLGFNGPIVSRETSKLAGESLVLTYNSQSAGRQVEVSYSRAQRGLSAVITVFIVASNDKRFSLEDWLAITGTVGAIEFSTINIPRVTETQFIERFCHDFEGICDKDLRGILMGDIWQDVPIDWKGYR